MDSARKRRGDIGGDVQREPGLAASARAGHGHQTRILPADQTPQVRDLRLPTDQRRPWDGKRRRLACRGRLRPLIVGGSAPRLLGPRARQIARIRNRYRSKPRQIPALRELDHDGVGATLEGVGTRRASREDAAPGRARWCRCEGRTTPRGRTLRRRSNTPSPRLPCRRGSDRRRTPEDDEGWARSRKCRFEVGAPLGRSPDRAVDQLFRAAIQALPQSSRYRTLLRITPQLTPPGRRSGAVTVTSLPFTPHG